MKFHINIFSRPQQHNFLSMVPERTIVEFTEDNEIITLLVPKFKSTSLRKWLIPKRKSPHFRISLGENGSQVWKLIDGKCTVDDICKKLSEILTSQGKAATQIEERVTKYLSELYKSRFVKFRPKESTTDNRL